MAVSCTIFYIFDIEQNCNLEIRIRGYSRYNWYNSIARLWFPTNFVSKVRCFEIFAFEQYRDLETRVSGHSRSLEMPSFHRSRIRLHNVHSRRCALLVISRSKWLVPWSGALLVQNTASSRSVVASYTSVLMSWRLLIWWILIRFCWQTDRKTNQT